jgi:hypothetical protein
LKGHSWPHARPPGVSDTSTHGVNLDLLCMPPKHLLSGSGLGRCGSARRPCPLRAPHALHLFTTNALTRRRWNQTTHSTPLRCLTQKDTQLPGESDQLSLLLLLLLLPPVQLTQALPLPPMEVRSIAPCMQATRCTIADNLEQTPWMQLLLQVQQLLGCLLGLPHSPSHMLHSPPCQLQQHSCHAPCKRPNISGRDCGMEVQGWGQGGLVAQHTATGLGTPTAAPCHAVVAICNTVHCRRDAALVAMATHTEPSLQDPPHTPRSPMQLH